jgi:hypothetical protein
MCADKHEELLEVWTQDGRPTSEIKTRKVIHEQGLWHKIGLPPPPPTKIRSFF